MSKEATEMKNIALTWHPEIGKKNVHKKLVCLVQKRLVSQLSPVQAGDTRVNLRPQVHPFHC